MLRKKENKEYLPIEGLASFRQATVDLLLGAGNPAIKEVRLLGFFLGDSMITRTSRNADGDAVSRGEG